MKLTPSFYEHAVKGLDEIDTKGRETYNVDLNLINTSCLQLSDFIEPDTVDLTITSPPYSNHLHKVANGFATYTYEKNIYKGQGRKLANPYSNMSADFGNATWEEYSNMVGELMGKLFMASKEGSYNVWVVRDYRDIEEHVPYVNLHGKIVELAIKAGWVLTDIVIWDQSAQRKLVKLGGIKARRFYFNIGYSYIIILRKNIKGEKFKTIA